MRTIRFLPAVFLALVLAASADPPNASLLDGRPTEYDGTDLRASFSGASAWGTGNVITNLFVTWDTNYLYLALQGWEDNNKLVILVDVDPGHGTGATTTTNWTGVLPDTIRYNDVGWEAYTGAGAAGFELDYMIASEGWYNNFLRVLYDGLGPPTSNNVEVLFNDGNGASPRGTAVDMVVQADATACELKGMEARIPWRELYNTNLGRFGAVDPGKIVPTGATLRLFANLHNNDPDASYSAPDAIPAQVSPNAHYTNGLLRTDTYLDLAIDQDLDGVPDVAGGDVNAPFIRGVAGLAGSRTAYALFNEDVVEAYATNAANWSVDGATPAFVHMAGSNAVLMELTNDLPAAGTLVRVAATNVADAVANDKYTWLCLFPAADGLSTSLTVRFYLETASGLGSSPGASAFHINGSALPLDWGYPPSRFAPLLPFSGSLHYRDVTFPPGTAPTLYYKYSGVLNNTGTNNFEALRLDNFMEPARALALNTNGVTMVVTDYLGAAAHPWRDANNTNLTAYADLYTDARRGDAGVRQRTTVTFQLDLSSRDLYGISRVLVQGTDPLRGFNVDGGGVSDWAGGVTVGWDRGGLTLYDDGTHGDTNAADGIYARTWSLTTDGNDSLFVPSAPNSLVGGGFSDLPYGGLGWTTRRTPRSFKYRFYVVDSSTNYYDSPEYDIEYYVQHGSGTNILLAPFAWADDGLPYLLFSNRAEIVGIERTGDSSTVHFTNITAQAVHGLQTAPTVDGPWNDYGSVPTGSQGVWQAATPADGADAEFFRVYAGPQPPNVVTYWSPNPLPPTGGVLNIWFSQIGRDLKGRRDVFLHCNVQSNGIINEPSWTGHPMTFLSNGLWTMALNVVSNTNDLVRFVFRNAASTIWDKDYGYPGADQYRVHVGGRATWTPEPLPRGGALTINYDSTGGPLEGSNVWLHAGFDKFEGTDWSGDISTAMTPVAGNQWTVTIQAPSNYTKTVNFLFRNDLTNVWDSAYDPTHWGAFIGD